jgi:hypothetical protein
MHRKLNQSITPLPSEILRCIRMDFEDGNESNEEDDNLDDNY